MLEMINKDNIDEIIKNNKNVVIDCFAPWCGPCRMLSPIIDSLASEMTDYKFCKMNTDDNQDIAYKYRIMSIPTLLIFKDGELVEKSVGFKTKDELKMLLEK